MMAASVARGSSFLKSIWSTRPSASFMRSSRSRITPSPFPSRGLQRKSAVLNSLLPLHSAIASSYLVSRLPSEVASSMEAGYMQFLGGYPLPAFLENLQDQLNFGTPFLHI